MPSPAYPAARAVAARIQPRFAADLDAARAHGHADVADLPDTDTMEQVIDAAFWASLRREEGYSPRISIALVPASRAGRPLIFERPLRLGPDILVPLAPAVERPGVHLGVWRDDRGLAIWGATRTIPALSFVLETAAPGLLVVKYRQPDESAKFVNVAVLEGDQIKVLDPRAVNVPARAKAAQMVLGFDPRTAGPDSANLLMQLAVSMREHRRGGTLLVVPAGSDDWRESILHPIPYAIAPPFSRLTDLVAAEAERRDGHEWRDNMQRAVAAIAGATAIDGATIITNRYELLAMGAKIHRRDGFERIERAILTEPVEGASPRLTTPAELGGTRHLSAAQFAHDQHDALALVASQDGRFTVFAWSPGEGMLGAHRIETLLL